MGRYSSKPTGVQSTDGSLVDAIAKLHLTRNSNQKQRHGPPLPRRSLHKHSSMLESVLAAAERMEIDHDESQHLEPSSVNSIVQIFRQAGRENPSAQEIDVGASECVKLLQSCGLSSDIHLSYLQQWQRVTSLVIASPVFSTAQFWSQHILLLSLKHTALHCALLAVAGLQHNRVTGLTDRIHLQAVYRLHAEAHRRLSYRSSVRQLDKEEKDKILVATQVCLLFFDYLSGNQEAWENTIWATKWSMQRAGYTNLDPVGRFFFYSVARQDCLAHYTRTIKHDSPGKYLSWDGLLEMQPSRSVDDQFDSTDQIGILYAELLRLQCCLLNLGGCMSEEDSDNINHHLDLWKESFPINLQTYAYTGEVHDKSCFLHALTCNGGSRAIALHCLFSELMLQLLSIESAKSHESIEPGPISNSSKDHQQAINAEIHKHAVTICRLAQSLSSDTILLDYDVAANFSAILGSLCIAGENLFSKDGKAWLDRLLRWVTKNTGNTYAENIADRLFGSQFVQQS